MEYLHVFYLDCKIRKKKTFYKDLIFCWLNSVKSQKQDYLETLSNNSTKKLYSWELKKIPKTFRFYIKEFMVIGDLRSKVG